MRTAITRMWRQVRRVRAGWWFLLGAVLATVGVLSWVPVDWPALAGGVGSTLASWGLWRGPGLLTLAGVGVLVAATVSTGVTRARRSTPSTRPTPMRPIPAWTIWAGLALVLAVGTLATWALVTSFGSGSPRDKAHLEAIKLAASIAVGTGGAAALLLAARRQRATEKGLVQQEQRAADARHDADERRVTELYTAAAQQLASDKAPVRLAGLYALERLGQSNPDHRQTIVNLFCAYLRMPYPSAEAEPTKDTAPVEESSAGARQDSENQPLLLDLAPTLAEAAGLSLDGAEQVQQERQVRRTAQRLLAERLRPNKFFESGRPPNPAFWPDIDLDLAGATLHQWNFSDCCVRYADFTNTHFHGPAQFCRTQFYGPAMFSGAQFHSLALFDGIAPSDDGAQFHSLAWFDAAQFHGPPNFSRARFHGIATFNEVWAYLDHNFPRKSAWPARYTVRNANPGDGQDGRWGKFVHKNKVSSCSQDGDAAAEETATEAESSSPAPAAEKTTDT